MFEVSVILIPCILYARDKEGGWGEARKYLILKGNKWPSCKYATSSLVATLQYCVLKFMVLYAEDFSSLLRALWHKTAISYQLSNG